MYAYLQAKNKTTFAGIKFMKGYHFIKLSFFFLYAMACAGKNEKENAGSYIDTTLTQKVAITDTFQKGKVITSVLCKEDAAQSYALYIPEKSNSEPMPVIYFFDPHGDGSLPLDKYKGWPIFIILFLLAVIIQRTEMILQQQKLSGMQCLMIHATGLILI